MSASHTFTVLSSPAADDASAVGAQGHADDRVSVCPLRVRRSWPVSASHTFTVLS